ncbi:MAG TPA: bifunctional phosphopantothenoylcysteine decarboxylase/phosphopantothenate synthase [Solirubrobacterales bacterium]|jgi:phosphopantothenoylcysteine decarboxylase/phosphopantothenate--cysteine ligase|nr:bifunctional phosphopantothenoylcysteine decarboxylase/phosphopantothenate synthase [Solirubrobacterales bacterium]
MARLLLGVSGGIAAYKSLEFARLATLAGHGVRVLMTENAERFVGAASFEGIVGAPVLTSEFERDPMRGAFPGEPGEEGHDPIGHLELASGCDAFLVAPASANTLAKLAGGFADSMLATSFLACTAPRLVAPAMNDRMYADAATQANLATLRERGVEVIEPGEGLLASRGERGRGRLPDPEELLARVEAALAGGDGSSAPTEVALPGGRQFPALAETALPGGEPGPWNGLRVLVTAGGTREPIDSVRFIGNRSSGRMGMALAAAAARRGAEVTVIAANVALPEPAGVKRIDVETTAELSYETVERFETQHVLLMAAAPADFRTEPITGKIKRQDSLNLNLQPTEDILASISAQRGEEQTVVGFAAEHGGDAVGRARAKLARKGADLIVLNDVSDPTIGFESAENEVLLVTADDEEQVPKASKDAVAEAILDRIDRLRATPGARDGNPAQTAG